MSTGRVSRPGTPLQEAMQATLVALHKPQLCEEPQGAVAVLHRDPHGLAHVCRFGHEIVE